MIIDETTTVTQKSARSAQNRPSTSNRARTRSSALLAVPSRRKREQQNETFQIAITELLNHFSHRNLDAIVRVIKMTLEKLRKRITTSLSYGN